MTEEHKPKKYLLMCDEMSRGLIAHLMPSLQFVQVEGMNMKDNETHLLLVQPIEKPDVQPEQ